MGLTAKKNGVRSLVLISDIFIMYVSLIFAQAIRHQSFAFLVDGRRDVAFYDFIVIFLAWTVILYLLDFYEFPPLQNIYKSFFLLFIFIALSIGLGSAFFYFQPLREISPKTILVLTTLLFSPLMFINRFIIKRFFLYNIPDKKILIIGFSNSISRIVSMVRNKFAFIGVASSDCESIGGNIPILKTINDVSDIFRRQHPDTILFASEDVKDINLVDSLLLMQKKNMEFISLPYFYENTFIKVDFSLIDKYQVLDAIASKNNSSYEIWKRVFDFISSLILLAVLMPVFVLIAFCIKITSYGFVIYRQKRVGKNNNIFTLYKFRSMLSNAEKNGPQWASKNDSRVTLVGSFLRASHLDELPQLFNILRGELSFVGPRPERPEFTSELKEKIPYYKYRHLIKPGLTGWAQVYYKASESVEEAQEKYAYDLYYIKNRSTLLDLRILIKTFQMILFRKKFG